MVLFIHKFRPRRGRFVAFAALSAAGLLFLAACSSEAPKPATGPSAEARRAASDANARSAPNLGTVPNRPQTASSSDQKSLEQGLKADRDAARYSDDQLRGRGASAPPQPAPVSQPPPSAPRAAPVPSQPYQPAYQQQNQVSPRGPQQGIPVYPGQEQVANVYASQLQASSSNQVSGADVAPTQLAGYPAAPRFEPSRFGALPNRHVATIVFGNGTAGLTAEDRTIISAVVAEQKRVGGAVRVVGHSSSRTRDMSLGQHDQLNNELATKRAQAVASEIARRGVPRDLVIVDARGDAEPVYYEAMPQAEAYNRRTEIYLER